MDYIEETRRKFWGKRDGFVWYFGLFGSFISFFGAAGAIAAGELVTVAAHGLMLGLFASYFMLQPWTRKALLALVPLAILGAIGQPRAELTAASGGGLLWTLFFVAALISPRNKLAFKIDVSDAEIQKLYDRYVSNPNASRALVYGLLSLGLPVLAPVALVLSIQSLRRVAPKAWPPIGGRRPALIGLVLAVLALLIWGWAIDEVLPRLYERS
jgi:hypothetical protein